MNRTTVRLALGFLLFCTSDVSAQFDFFWSEFDLSDGATNSDANVTYAKGDSGSLFLYYSTNGMSDSDLNVGAFLDITTSVPGAIEFTRAETFDFDIVSPGVPIGRRWVGFDGGGGSAGETGTVSENLIDEWHAFTVLEFGIREKFNQMGSAFLDLGYDSSADAFIFGVVDFTVVGNPGDSVDILMGAGDGLIVNNGKALDPFFGGATITVSAIPEPTSAVFLWAALVGLFTNRRSANKIAG